MLLILLATLVAWYGKNWLLLAFLAGGIGGILHELNQSGGKFFLPEADAKEYYLGSFVGFFLGGVAGLITLRSFLLAVPPAGTPVGAGSFYAYQIVIESLIAGLALKGVAEAATDKNAKDTKNAGGGAGTGTDAGGS